MSLTNVHKVAAIISDAGGSIVGRTRLQKIAYLLNVTGLDDGFAFSYKHYGPYSEDLADAARLGGVLGDIKETEHTTSWGGWYSVFTTEPHLENITNEQRRTLAKAAADADAVELELAATAVFLSKEGYVDAWAETERRKPEKAGNGKLLRAQQLLSTLARIQTPIPLPEIR